MTLLLWTAVAVLVGLIAVLQFVGVRALAAWGVQPSRAVLALRAFNLLLVVLLIGYALWEWVNH